MIESIFKFLTEIAICFSKCWKFSFFYIRSNEHFFHLNFSKNFFFSNYAKKKWKNDFFIFHTSSQNFSFITLRNFTKEKKSFTNFFRFTMFSSDVWFHYDIFFFDFWDATFFFFHWFSKSNRFFNIFSFSETRRRVRFLL